MNRAEAPLPDSRNSIGEEIGALATLAGPIAISQYALMALSLVDTAIVGNVSTAMLAGVALSRALLFAVSSFGLGVAIAMEPIVSQAVGANEHTRARGSVRNALWTVTILWPVSTIVAWLGLMTLPLFGVAAIEAAAARDFFWGSALGNLFFLAFACSKSFLQAYERTGPALIASVFANVANYVLCKIFVRSMGAFGAGLAGSIAAFILFAYVWLAARRAGPKDPEGTSSNAATVREIVRLALPLGLQFLAEIGVFTITLGFAGKFGKTSIAAHQIALMLASFTFMGALGIGGAVAVRVGRAIGEGRSPRRAGLIGIGVGGTYMLTSAMVFTLFPGELVRIFSSDPEVVPLAITLVRIAAVFQFFDGIQVVSAGALRGAGDVNYPFAANVACHWGIGLPCALLFAFVLGGRTAGLWWGLTAGLIAVAMALSVRFWMLSKRRIERV